MRPKLPSKLPTLTNAMMALVLALCCSTQSWADSMVTEELSPAANAVKAELESKIQSAPGSHAAITQEGWENAILMQQNGTSWANAYQGGIDNQLYATQSGSGNVLSSTQQGEHNRVEAVQTGTDNLLQTEQYGSNNLIDIEMLGNSQFAWLYQEGTGNQISAHLAGTSNALAVQQIGNNNLVDVNVQSSARTIGITQHGNNLGLAINHP